jgi:hypothetical protein
MWKFRAARDEASLREFVEGFRQYGGPVPEARFSDYLPYAECQLMRDRQGKLVGGYALCELSRARCLKSLPDRAQALVQRDLQAHSTKELNLIWLAPELRRGPASMWLWLQLAKHLGWAAGAERIIYAADLAKPGLITLYEKISEGLLYRGPVRDDLAVDLCVAVYWSTPRRFRRLPRMYAAELAARAGRDVWQAARSRWRTSSW